MVKPLFVSITGKQKEYTTFACSVIGASHIKKGQPCQDSSLTEKGGKYRFAAVADGHGGEAYFRSDTGSRFAIEALRSCVFDQTAGTALKKLSANNKQKEIEKVLLQIKKSVIHRWNTLVAQDIKTRPFTEEELNAISQKDADEYRKGEQTERAYGTTLIAVLWTDTFFLAMQIGDGACVILDSQAEFSQPVPVDEKCFLNVTTSLCDRNVIDSFRHYYSAAPPAAAIIGTDGIDDCFAGAEKLYDFYRVILSSFMEKDAQAAGTELKDYFPRLSEKGSGDDVSIGIIIDDEKLKTLNIISANKEVKSEE